MAAPDTTTQKDQLGAYSGQLYTATVTCEGAGAVCEEEANVDITEAGIRLNLARIGIINNTPKYPPKYLQEISEAQFQEFRTEGLPNIELSNYRYVLTSLRVGYLYIINDSDAEGWSEWEVSESQELIEVSKAQADKDIRIRDNQGRTLRQYIANPEDKLYIAYSDFQWSAAYFKKMRTDSSARKERMQLFDGPAHVQKNQQTNVFGASQAQQHMVFVPENMVGLSFLQQSINVALADAETCEADYDIDPVICLDDPIGIALEINNTLISHWFEMNALLIALKIGVDIPKVSQCLRKKGQPESLQKPEVLLQAKALFNIASTWRTVALINEKNKEDLVDAWGGLAMDRIDKVLGKTKREERRAKINTTRQALVHYLESDYFKKYKPYQELTGASLADAKSLLLLFLQQLAPSPVKMDSFLLTAQELSQWKNDAINKEVITFIANQIKGQGTIGPVLEEKNILEKLEDQKNLLKIFGIIGAFLDIFTDLHDNGADIIEDLNKLINKNILKDFTEEANETITELSDLYSEFRRTDLGEFTEDILNMNKKSRKAFEKALRHGVTEADDFMNAKQIVFTKSFERSMRSTLVIKGKQLQQHPRWQRLIRNLSAVNLALTVAEMRKVENSFEKYLTVAKIVQSLGEVAVAQNRIKPINTRGLVKIGSKFADRIGYFGALIDATEAGYEFWRRDYDAGFAKGLAAVTGATSTFILAGGLATAGIANSWNPVGWGLLLVSVGIGFYAKYLEDSNLERIAKNGIFGRGASVHLRTGNPRVNARKKIKDTSASDPIAYIQRHLSRTAQMHKTGFTQWEYLTNQYQALMHILINGRITVTSNKAVEYQVDMERNPEALELNKTYEVTQLLVDFDFGGFLTDVADIQLKIVYYPQGRDAGNPKVLTPQQVNAMIPYGRDLKLTMEKGKNPIARLALNIPDRYRQNGKGEAINTHADLMIIAYLGVSGGRGQHVPIKTKTGELNYLAAIHALQIKRDIGEKNRIDYKKGRDRKGHGSATENDLINSQGWI